MSKRMRTEPENKWAQQAPKAARSAHTGKGSSRPWKTLSRALRANQPICEVCGVKPSTEVHHVVKWSASVVGRLDPRNCICCCRTCHELLEKAS
jgi:5-methylcytosine-specific restriction endonuclease McrA